MFDNVNQKVSFERREDADGKVWVEAVAHAALTAKTPYKIIVNEYGYVTAALNQDTAMYYVGVPAEDVSSGDEAWLQIGGALSDMITPSLSVSVGHALKINGATGAVADAGADYSGSTGEFAVCTSASTSSTTQDVILVPDRITVAS